MTTPPIHAEKSPRSESQRAPCESQRARSESQRAPCESQRARSESRRAPPCELFSESTVKQLMASYFRLHTPIDFQIDGFNVFMSSMLPHMIAEQPNIVVCSRTHRVRHCLSF